MQANTSNLNESVEIGAIYCADVGYSMCIPEFFKVAARKGKSSLILRRIPRKVTEGTGWRGWCVAGEDDGKGETFVARMRPGGDGDVVVNGRHAARWNGTREYYDFAD